MDNVNYYNKIFTLFGKSKMRINEIFEEYKEYSKIIKPFVTDTSILLNNKFSNNENILFEGAQGSLLCLDHGTYPYVTSSSPTAAAVPLNTGISPKYIDQILGVTKSYSTRVGSGYFPTEVENNVTKKIRNVGNEYGTTTGRPRRIGWLDTVVLRHSKRINGLTALSVMLLDVLSGIETLKICKKYELNGEIIDYIPASIKDVERCKPVYIELPGWKKDITKVAKFSDLPLNAKNYLNKISELTRLDLAMFSVGPDRKQTIVLKEMY